MSGVDPPILSLGYTSTVDASAQPVFAFDGSASITGAGVAWPAGGATLTMWLNAPASAAIGVILGYAQNPAGNPGRLWIKNPGALLVGVGSTQTPATGIGFADGAWHHLAVTVAPRGATAYAVGIYLDGSPVWYGLSALVNPDGLAISATGDLVLGQGVSGEPGLVAQMSQFVLWSGVLTDAAILSLMQTRPPSTAQTPVNWALTSAQTAGQVQGGAFATSSPPLRFRSGRTLTASWAPATIEGATFDLAVASSDSVYHAPQAGLATSPATVPSPQAGVTYQAAVRAVSGGTPGPWSVPATAVALDLGQPVPSLAPATASPFPLSWPGVDQAAQYTLSFLRNGTTSVPPSGTQTGTSVDITTLVQDPANTYTYSVTATGGGSTGPASAAAAQPGTPVVSLAYGPGGTGTDALVASWTAADNAPQRYLSVVRVDGGTSTPVAGVILPGSQLSYTVPVTVQDGQVYRATLRGLAQGVIGPWSAAAQVTIHTFGTPVFGTITGDYNAHTLTVPWTFTNPAGGDALFDLQLWNADKTQQVGESNPATSPTVFTDSAIVQGVTFNLRIRAYQDGSTGPWSAWQTAAADGVPQVVGLSAAADVYGTITASWSSVLAQNPGLQGVTYVATIYKPDGTVLYTVPAQAGTSISLSKSTTGVQANTTYTLKVVASATGYVSGPASAPVSVTIGQVQPWPPPPQNTINDPVDTGTGAFLYSSDDLVVNGVFPLVFTTYYSSTRPLPSESPVYAQTPLGNRWNHVFNTALSIDQTSGYLYVVWGNGGVERFGIPQSAGAPYTNAGAALGSTLSRGNDGAYTLSRPGRRTLRFTSAGRLSALVDPNGNQATLAYNGQNQLTSVTDPQSGHTLTLTYNGGWLETVSDGTRTIRYAVTSGTLASFTNAAGKTRRFTYASGATALIETIVDFSGRTALRNSYQDGRMRFQQDARSLAAGASYGTTFQWSTGTYALAATTVLDVTDRMGNASHFESLAGNGALLLERYALDATNILVRTHSYDAYANPLATVEYQGPAASYQSGMGNTTAYGWTANGQRESVVTQLGGGLVHARSWIYNADGSPWKEAVYEGPASGWQVGAGNVTTFAYYGDHTLRSVQPPLGSAVQYTYWSGGTRGLVKTLTDELGNVFEMAWDGNGMLQTATDPYGWATGFEWDGAGALRQASVGTGADPALRTMRYGRNALGQVSSATLWFPAAGQEESQAYVTGATYDDEGNRHVLTDPTDASVTYAYDENNNLTSVTWSAFRDSSRSTAWSYDRNDFLSGTTWSAASPTVAETYLNDALGRRTQLTDPRGAVWSYGLGMTPGSTGPLPLVETDDWPAPEMGAPVAQESTTFDALGRVTRAVDRGGVVTIVAWSTRADAPTGTQQTVATITRPPAQPGGQNLVQTRSWDALGRLVKVVDEAGKSWNWTYAVETDAATGKKVMVATRTDPAGRESAVATDSRGRLAFTRASGAGVSRLTEIAYDGISRITSVTQSQGDETATATQSYGYDAASRYVTTSLGRPGGGGGDTVLSFNGRGERVTQADPFGNPSSYTYSPWGALATFADGRGKAFTYAFDAAGRLSSVTLPDTTQVTQTLDANGNRLSTQVGAAAGITRAFDAWNRLLTRTDAAGRVVAYQYWPADQTKRITYPGNLSAGYTVDGVGRMDTVTDWSARAAQYAWSATGLVTGVTYRTASGTAYAAAAYGYDDAGCATSYQHTAGELVLAGGTYVLDGLGQPATATVQLPLPPTLPAAGRALTYTAGNQLATLDGVQQAFDDAGNWLGAQGASPVTAYDDYGRIVGWGADVYGYDLDGLRTAATLSGVATADVYDVAEWESPQVERGDPWRAVEAALLGQSPFAVASWDPLYGMDAVPAARPMDRLLAGYDSGGVATARHLHGVGLLGSEDASGVFSAALCDLSGNVVSRVTEAGDVIDGVAYGPYGDRYGRLGTGPYPFLYNGRDGVQDDGNGLLHMRARGYAPGQLRFLQPDLLLGDPGLPMTLNRYAFAAGNPLQANDPLGLAVVAVVIGGAVLGTAAIVGAWLWGTGALGGGAAGGGAGAVGAGGAGLRPGGARGGGNRGGGNNRGGNNRGGNNRGANDGEGGYGARDARNSIELEELIPRQRSPSSDGLRYRGNRTNLSRGGESPYGNNGSPGSPSAINFNEDF